MNLKQKLFIVIFSLLTFFGGVITFYAKDISIKINEKWGTRFVSQQLSFDKTKTLSPIINEVALVHKLAQEQSVIAMALDESNQTIKTKALQTLSKYKQKFHSRSYFTAFLNSKHYYYADKNNSFDSTKPVYTLDVTNKDDEWFFKTIEQNKEFNINIEKDVKTGITNVWINHQIKYNSKVIGVIGTGFDLQSFLKNFVDMQQEGVYNIFVDENLAVQLERDSKFIDYGSITKLKKDRKTVSVFLDSEKEYQKLKKVIDKLKSTQSDDIEILWLNFKGHEHLVGVSYIKELGWFNITAVDAVTLDTVDSRDITPNFILLLVMLLVIMGVFVHFQIIKPIDILKQQMEDISQNGYEGNIIDIDGHDEIAKLSKQFQELLKIVSEHEQELETTVKKRTKELYEKQQYLNNILDNVDAYIFIKDKNFRYTYVNKAMQQAMNEPLENIIGKDISKLYDEKAVKFIQKMDEKVFLSGEKTVDEEKVIVEGVGTFYVIVKRVPLFDQDGNIYAILGVSTDITERKKHEQLVKEMAYYDTLTKLPNRRLLEDRLKQMLAKIKREHKYGALMFLDMDNFKSINDTYGHDVGDMLLIEASKRYLQVVRESDTVARLGGDEFVVAVSGLSNDIEIAKQEALEVADKILKMANQKYVIDMMKEDGTKKHIEFVCTSSIGITIFNSQDNSIDAILKRADKAMYEVKNSRKNGIYMWGQ